MDLRNRIAFADGHVVGSVNIGLDGSFATYLGWVIPAGSAITLLGDDPRQILQAHRELSHIGIDPAAQATGTVADWTGGRSAGQHQRARFADLEQERHHRPITVLDVRRRLEHDADHLSGALWIPLHELLARLEEVPVGEVWVHCAAGYRAPIAASVLAAWLRL